MVYKPVDFGGLTSPYSSCWWPIWFDILIIICHYIPLRRVLVTRMQFTVVYESMGRDRERREKPQRSNPTGSMYGIYANIWGILMVNVTITYIHGSVMGMNLMWTHRGWVPLLNEEQLAWCAIDRSRQQRLGTSGASGVGMLAADPRAVAIGPMDLQRAQTIWWNSPPLG